MPSGQIFAATRSKNRAYCRVHHLKYFTLNDFFFTPRIELVLKDVKHTNLVLQKQLISTKHFLIYTHFAVGGKGLKNAYFHPSTVQNPHMF